jgi:hypothetical protein
VREPAIVLRAVGFLTLLLLAGAVVARSGKSRADLFAATWWGLAVTSLVGVVLARSGAFSIGRLGFALGAVALLAVPVVWWRGRVSADPAVPRLELRRMRVFAVVAGALAFAWFWPPFETFMAASDSTMYVDAGIHLARTGSYDVADTVARLLPPDLAQALFRSVGVFEQGPYIRLPGGLLMHARDAPTATPAFFPLVSMWTGVVAALGGPEAATIVAPLGMALATWALTLFAGEAFGLAVAVPTALVFVGNFAVWWFGRFPMSEALTIAFVWGGLVFLGRGAPLTAGIMIGIGGVARAETLVFAAGAVAVWWAWTMVPIRQVLAIAVGAALAGALAAAGLFASPNHHVAYLANDLAFAWVRLVYRLLPAITDGRISAALVLFPLVPLTFGVAAAWRGRGMVRGSARVLIVVGLVLVTVLYLRLGGRADPLRHLGWLATSMSPLGLALGLAGGVVVWRRGGPAARLGAILVVLVAAIFVPSPRVASYQPWAMRRFLPVVLPGLALGAGAVVGALWMTERRAWRVVAVALALVTFGLQVRPTLAMRSRGYYDASFESVRSLAERIPPSGVVVLDGGFADLQIQVPLWLVFGRESLVATGGGPAWRTLLEKLVQGERAPYWIQSRYAPPPQAKNLAFTRIGEPIELVVPLPDSPADVPPTAVMRKLVPLQIYGVGPGVGGSP